MKMADSKGYTNLDSKPTWFLLVFFFLLVAMFASG